MLGEVYRLRQALEKAGVEMEKLHPAIKVPGSTTGPAGRLRLRENGNVAGLEPLTRDEMPGLWCHLVTSEGSFPVLRIKEPLLLLPEGFHFSWQQAADKKAAKVSAGEKRKQMLAVVDQCIPNAGMDTAREMLQRVCSEKSDTLAQAAEQAKLADVATMCRAYQMALKSKCSLEGADALLEGMQAQAVAMLATCDESALELLELLLFEPGNKPGEYTRKSAQIALDIANPDSHVYRSATRRAMSKAMLESQNAAQSEPVLEEMAAPIPCAFTGSQSEPLHSGSFPSIKLPFVAPKGLALFSMNSAAPCNGRYGQRDTALMPVARSVVLKMQDALSHIVAPDRRNKTWRPIAGEKPDQPDLLIVYVDGAPEIDANVADLFGADDDQNQRQYDVDVKTVCEALNGIVAEHPDSVLNLFIIHKASEGQAFVALTETPTVAEVLKGAEWWQQAARNVPQFALPIRVEEQLEHWTPQTPSPVQVVQTLTQLWTPAGGGSGQPRSNKVRGVAFGEILNLMLQRPRKSQQAAFHILQTLLQREKALLIGIGGCIHSRRGWENYTDTARRVALRAASLLGITLYALDSNKEDYVTQEAFRIGQFLALADRLHHCYCTVVRDGSYPPNLIGNAAFDSALDNPEQALSTLAARMRVYIGWAETVGMEQKTEPKTIAVRESKSILNRYKTLASHFANADVPPECSDADRAKMLLGYMASTKDANDKSNENGYGDKLSTGDKE